MYHTTQSNIKEYLLRVLAKKDYSRNEIIAKAEIKGVSGSELKEIIHWLEQEGFINDVRLAESIVAYYGGKKGVKWLNAKLLSRKLSTTIINEVLSKSLIAPTPALKKKLESKYSISNWKKVDVATQQKIYNYLARQGFDNPFDILDDWKKE